MKNILTPYNRARPSRLLVLLPVFLVLIGVVCVYNAKPHTSELMFLEFSILGKGAGSVIPASCDSAPPTSHFSGDCDPMLNIGVGGDTSSFTDINLIVSSTTSEYNEKPSMSWTTTGYTSCTLIQTAEGVQTIITPSVPGLSQSPFTLSYVNETQAQQDVTYALNCVNAPYKNDTKAVRVYYNYLPR